MTRVPRCRITLLGLGILTLLGTNPLSAQEKAKGTWTFDGETRSLDISSCSLTQMNAYSTNVTVTGTDDANQINFKLNESVGSTTTRQKGSFEELVAKSETEFVLVHRLQALYIKEAGVWTSFYTGGEPVPGPLFRIDGSTVIVSGTFTDQGTDGEHVVELSVECTRPEIGGYRGVRKPGR